MNQYPFQSNYLKLKPVDHRLHYLDEGPYLTTGSSETAPAVLMLHGNPTWSFMYRDLIRALSGRWRCIAPDHIGCGFSDKPELKNYEYCLSQRIDDLEQLIDHLKLTSINLIVHDWGGAVGFGLAGRKPELINKLIVMNTAAFRSNDLPLRIAACRIPVLGQLLVMGLNGFARAALFMALNNPAKLSADIRRGFLAPYNTYSSRRAIYEFVKDIPIKSVHRSYLELCRIEHNLLRLKHKPLRIFWGMKDFCFHSEFLKRWTELFPNAEVTTYSEAGHYLLEEAGSDIIQQIAEFLSRRSL